MKIFLKKFGTTLISRQLGKEAFLAFKHNLTDIGPNEAIEIDFEGVITFSPSWGDEFLSPLYEQFGGRITFVNTDNPSVKLTLETLGKIGDMR